MHDVEIERRRQADKTIDKIAVFVEHKIPALITRVNIMVGYSLLASLLIVGSFYYTSESKRETRENIAHVSEDAIFHQSNTDAQISAMAGQLSKLTVTVTRTEEKQLALVRELKTLNGYLEILVQEKIQNPGEGHVQ
jgi:hypothetical protein